MYYLPMDMGKYGDLYFMNFALYLLLLGSVVVFLLFSVGDTSYDHPTHNSPFDSTF